MTNGERPRVSNYEKILLHSLANHSERHRYCQDNDRVMGKNPTPYDGQPWYSDDKKPDKNMDIMTKFFASF